MSIRPGYAETGQEFWYCRQSWWLVIMSLLCISAPLSASSDVDRLLASMAIAIEQSDYRGIFTYARGADMQTMQVFHRYRNGIEQERLVQLDGDQGEILRNGNEVVCLLPGNQQVSLAQSFLGASLNKALSQGLMPNELFYDVVVNRGQRVADRGAVRISLKAKDNHRYHFLLWLDEQSHLLLKAVLLDSNEHILEKFQFNQIEIGVAIHDEELTSKLQGQVKFQHEVPPLKVAKLWPEDFRWQVLWTPGGFKRVDDSAQNELGADAIQIYADGMTSFSVYVEQSSDLVMPVGAAKVGATTAYTHYLTWRDMSFVVMVVGEIPPMAAMKVAESVAPQVR